MEIKNIRLVISQPPTSKAPSEWDFDTDMLAGAQTVASNGANLALGLVGQSDDVLFKVRSEVDGVKEYEYLRPGDAQCQYCPAMADCPAAKQAVAAATDLSCERLSDPTPLETEVIPVFGNAEEMAGMYGKLGMIRKWCDAVEAKVFGMVKSGQITAEHGWKLVNGRDGNRAWDNPATVEEMLKGWRLKTEQMYSLSLISPTQAEAVLAENPRRWKKLQEHITRKPGKQEVAPVGDKRPAINVGPSADGFDVIEEPAVVTPPPAVVEDDGSDLC